MLLYIHKNITQPLKKEWNNAIFSYMDRSRGFTLSKVSQNERQIPYDITLIWDLKYDTNEHICKTETDLQTQRLDLWFPRGRRMGEGMIGSLGLADNKLLHLEWIKSKVLLYSTENYIQYLVINHNGKEYFFKSDQRT